MSLSEVPYRVDVAAAEVVRLALSTLASALAQAAELESRTYRCGTCRSGRSVMQANGWHSERLGPALCAALRKEGTTKRHAVGCECI